MNRRNETFNAAALIHGGTKTNKKPPLDGMFDTSNHRCRLSDLANNICDVDNLQERVVSKAYSKRVCSLENSEENVIRSVATYYSAGVMGKRKYKAVRLVLSTKTSKRKDGGRTSLCIMHKCAVPKLSPYNKLIGYINHIDIGKVYSVKEEFSHSFLKPKSV